MPPLREALEAYRAEFPEAMTEVDALPEGELNRRLLTLMRRRLQRTLTHPGDGEAYPNAAAFAADLDLLNASLRACRGERLARQLVEPLRRELATFGFHLHSLDIRQHARVHAQALAELAVGAAHAAQPEGPRPAPPSEQTGQILDTLRERMLPMLIDEFRRTRRLLLELTGQRQLLEKDPDLAHSLRLRNPYVDPMSLIQVELLRRKRAGKGSEQLDYVLAATINGIAAGLRNTG